MKNLLDKYLKYGHSDLDTLKRNALDAGVCHAIEMHYGYIAKCIFTRWYETKYTAKREFARWRKTKDPCGGYIVTPVSYYLWKYNITSTMLEDIISNSTTRRIGLICEFMRSPYYFMNKEYFNFRNIHNYEKLIR